MKLLTLLTFCISEKFVITRNYGEDSLFEEDEEAVPRGEQESAFVPDLFLGHPAGDIFNPCPGHSTGLAGQSFLDLVNTLVISQCVLAAPCSYPRDVGGECRSKTVFDFIVIGGGTAGSVIASRLSEIPDWNILLLEAGGDPPMTSDVPFFYNNLWRTDVDWQYQTIRERGLYNGFMGKVNRWPRGKMLGGSSSIGNLLYVRGVRNDFDNMAADGNIGWAYDEVLPYFKKSEDMRYFKIIDNAILAAYHNRGGPLAISRFGEKFPLAEVIESAATDLGYSTNYDINGVTVTGFTSPNVGTVRNGERINTAKAFLNPVKSRQNLFVIKHARVTKIHICPKTRRAYGIDYYYRNEQVPRTLRASREIILSAGVIESPKLLMLSGVGPKNDLLDFNIYVIENLRVGRNLIDPVMHPLLPISIQFENLTRTPLDILDYTYEYLTRRTGLLATIGVSEIIGMLDVNDDDRPDLQLQFLYAMLNETTVITEFAKNLGFEEEIALQLLRIISFSDLIIPQVMLLRPKSKGSIKLKSTDPFDQPIIQGSYLEDPRDLENIMSGIRFVERLANQDYLKFWNSSMEYLYFPGCCGLDPGSDYYWACSLSHLAGTGHNQVGTCRMGPNKDPDAVVDPQLRVKGIKGLRVADGSILPTSITGSAMAAVVMIGEKASDIIKLQWLPNYRPVFTTNSPFIRPTTLPKLRNLKFQLPDFKTPPPDVYRLPFAEDPSST